MFDLELRDVMAKLREEIVQANAAASAERFKFEIDELEVEFQLLVTKNAQGKTGISFWLVDAAAEGGISSAKTQRIKFRLRVSGNGNEPVAIESRRTEPPGKRD